MAWPWSVARVCRAPSRKKRPAGRFHSRRYVIKLLLGRLVPPACAHILGNSLVNAADAAFGQRVIAQNAEDIPPVRRGGELRPAIDREDLEHVAMWTSSRRR